jgi:hypothetical protein
VTSPRRDVRPTRDFYLALERQLPAERGPAGQPSRTDFQFHELVPIFTTFATAWDALPRLVPGREDYRVLVVRGVLLRAISVIGQLAPDGAIELVDIELDTTWPEDDGGDIDEDAGS